MTEYEKMVADLYDQGVLVDEAILPRRAPGVSGLYVQCQGEAPAVLVNGRMSEREKRCVLAEEAGHHYRTCGKVAELNTAGERKQEDAGRRWAYERLLPLDRIAACYLDGNQDLYQMAQELDVTPEFFQAALAYYHQKHGVFTRLGEGISVRFDPYFEAYREPEAHEDITFMSRDKLPIPAQSLEWLKELIRGAFQRAFPPSAPG